MMYVIIGLVFLGIILSIIRLIKGKELENRVVAIDTVTTMITGVLVIFAHISNNSLLLDVALVYAILAFISVVAIARYLEGGM
ncbi:putative monovalent cation/H+ antiporter subunit F [Clostridium tepidiprofundi DSM 19306]|uniref:Putative monovalent cation/H+ antiporter subunit F n=1 Tax=Clostridium tepidiprofundi DSM 19306 TaxID=1121338 RepID=A0A151B669_9CLOT|nr:monovalent cation/H+ antiporter complex subunit F [Clostridium tepidiprofundi]KYH35293.1 putative monovalent cation/H+ antiporter subunit F [Clostridium tepidiprofundi DSM 19306]